MTPNEQELNNRVRHLEESIDTLNGIIENYKQMLEVKDERIKAKDTTINLLIKKLEQYEETDIERLEKKQAWLECLNATGVDNWEGYDVALERWEEEYQEHWGEL